MKIRNKATGETIEIDPNNASKYGIQMNPDEGALQRALPQQVKDTPIIGNIAKGISGGIETIAEGGRAAGQMIMGDRSPYKPAFISQNEAQGLNGSFGDATGQAIGAGLNAGLSVDAIAAGPGMVKGGYNIAKQSPHLLDYLPGLTGKAIGRSVEKATKAGATDSWGNYKTEALQAVGDKFGKNAPEYLKIARQRLEGLGKPVVNQATSQLERPPLTPKVLVALRQQAAERLKSSSGKLSMGSPADKVDEVLRDVASKRAKDITPRLGSLDRAYTIQKRLAPQLKSAAFKTAGVGAGGGIALTLLNELLKGVRSGDQAP